MLTPLLLTLIGEHFIPVATAREVTNRKKT